MNNFRKTFGTISILVLLLISVNAQKGEVIIKQERYFYDTLKEGKLDLLPKLFHKNFHGVFGGGYIDRNAEIEGFKSAILIDYSFSNIIVKFPAKNVAIMMYKSYIKGSSKGKTVTGESYRTSTWVRKGKKWKMILHTDVPVGNTLAKENENLAEKNKNFIGITTIAYHVNDVNKAKEWYAKAFEQKQYFDEPFYVGFNINGFELGLQPEESDLQKVKSEKSLAYWAVKDVQKVFDRMIKLGAKVNEKPNEVGGGVITASVEDPWGNIIGLMFNPVFNK